MTSKLTRKEVAKLMESGGIAYGDLNNCADVWDHPALQTKTVSSQGKTSVFVRRVRLSTGEKLGLVSRHFFAPMFRRLPVPPLELTSSATAAALPLLARPDVVDELTDVLRLGVAHD